MNLILHQFQTDVRHFRWQLFILWLAFAFEPVLIVTQSLPAEGLGMLQALLVLWQIFSAVLLITMLVQADPLVGTSAAWLTRPVRRRHLFWAKSAFIALLLVMPRLAAQGLGWMLHGYSWHLWLCAVGQSLMFTAAIALVAAVLAALTRDLARFFLALGIMVGGIFAWTVTVEMLARANVIHQAAANRIEVPSFHASVTTVAWLVLIAGALAAWMVQARLRCWWLGVILFAIGVMAFPLIETSWHINFLRPRLMPSVPLTVSLWTDSYQTNPPAGQRLSMELFVAGVPPQHVAVMQYVQASVKFDTEGERQRKYLQPIHNAAALGRLRPADSTQKGEYFSVIQEFFPAQTLWFSDSFQTGLEFAFYNIYGDAVMKQYTNNPPAGSLNGRVELDLFAVKKVAEMPLRPATVEIIPGQHVIIQNVQLAGGVITVTLGESTASLLWNRDMNNAGFDSTGYINQQLCTFVLYHPGSGEALLVQPNNFNNAFPAFVNGETLRTLQLRFPYPALRERFAGMTAAEWLREARLCVFAPVYEGTTYQAFSQEHYNWAARNLYNQNQKTDLTGADAIRRAALSANPTAAQINSYLDDLLSNAPAVFNSGDQNLMVRKITAVGTNGLPALLRRLPLNQNLENNIVLPIVRKLVTRDQLPKLRDALQRDDRVIDIFLNKHWEADACDVLIRKLADHREPLPADALRIIAEAKDPATYADLRWHFVNLNYGHDRVIPALEQCPGFDAAAAVREAWRRARLGLSSTADLALAAAKQGLPDALNLAVIGLDNFPDTSRVRRELPQLAALTGYDGPATNTLAWIDAHLEQFHFDVAQRHYTLESTP